MGGGRDDLQSYFCKSLLLQITPPTSSKLSVGSTSCGSDWSLHNGEVGFHLICCLLNENISSGNQPPCKLWKLQSKPHDLDPRENSWEVGGVVCEIHGRWEGWFAKVLLQITPPTSSKLSVGSISCGSDWSLHNFHGEVGFHLICCLVNHKDGYTYFTRCCKINIWIDNWIPRSHNLKVVTPRGNRVVSTIDELINPIERWSGPFFGRLMYTGSSKSHFFHGREDLVAWHHNRSGLFRWNQHNIVNVLTSLDMMPLCLAPLCMTWRKGQTCFNLGLLPRHILLIVEGPRLYCFLNQRPIIYCILYHLLFKYMNISIYKSTYFRFHYQ
jgi:hypothetical protein